MKTKASLVAQTVECLSAMQETWVRSLGWEDPLETEMAIHSSTIAWKIPWTEEPCRIQSMGSKRVGHDWATSLRLPSTSPSILDMLVSSAWSVVVMITIVILTLIQSIDSNLESFSSQFSDLAHASFGWPYCRILLLWLFPLLVIPALTLPLRNNLKSSL